MLLLAGRTSAQITTTLSVPEICASPGDTVITLPINLDNPNVIVRALNFTVQMSSPELTLTGVACTARTLNYLCDAQQVGNNVNVVVLTTGTGTVLGTSGSVVELTFSDTDPACTLDSHVDLTITTATVVDNSMPDPQPVPTNLVAGGFTCGCPLGTTTSTTSPTFTTTTTTSTSTTTSSSTTSSSTTTSTSTSSTTSTSVEGTTTTSISVTTTTSSSSTTSTTSSTSSTSTTSTSTTSTTSTSAEGSTTTSTSSSTSSTTSTSVTTSTSTSSSTATTATSTTETSTTSTSTSTTIPTGESCADLQARIQAEVGDGSGFENHGLLMMRVNQLLNAEKPLDADCRACIVRQFARQVPTADQQACGPQDSARAAFAVGVDQPLSAVKLLLKSSATTEKALFLSKDEAIQAPLLNSPNDPTLFGASVEFCSAGGHAAFDLPAHAWHQNGSGTVFKYTQSGSGADVKVALLKSGRTLKIVSRAVGLPLTGGIGPVGVRVTTGEVRNCALFTSSTIFKDEPGKYIAQSALAGAIADCSDVSLGCPSQP